MNRPPAALDAEALLRRVAERVPDSLRGNIVVIGSIATAWAFRDVARTAMVATKDIDLLLLAGARHALQALEPYLREAHQIAVTSVLAPHATPIEAYRRAIVGLGSVVQSPRLRG